MSRKRGMLPSYWVNLDEIAQIFLDLINKKTHTDYGKQKIKGLHLEVTKNIQNQEANWVVDEKIIAITGIDFLPNDCRNIGYTNCFDMYINNELYFENIYIKETEEYKHFNIRKPLKENDEIKFILKNNDNMLNNIMWNIHYIGDIKIKEYNIICKDIDTDDIISKKTISLVQPFDEQQVCPIDLQGYTKVSEECIIINNNDEIKDIIFYYKKEEMEILHDYDILCKLYWQSKVDIDLHCLIDGEDEVYFSNKEIGIDNNKCWLDYDYREWEEKPEIITILGFKEKKALIKVNHYAGILPDDENIKLEIYKKDKNKMDVLLREIIFKGSDLENKIAKEICEIDLKTQKIRKLI